MKKTCVILTCILHIMFQISSCLLVVNSLKLFYTLNSMVSLCHAIGLLSYRNICNFVCNFSHAHDHCFNFENTNSYVITQSTVCVWIGIITSLNALETGVCVSWAAWVGGGNAPPSLSFSYIYFYFIYLHIEIKA